jgi:hypothetical protein
MVSYRDRQEDRAMSQAYDEDVLEWSEHQAALLRRLASGDQANETPDWENIIEEVESVGRNQLSAVRSLLVPALLHDLKCQAWPSARDVPHWRAEARGFRDDAAEAFTPSMRQRIDMDDLYRRALTRLPESHDGQPALPVPEACPMTLDAMVSRTG